MRDVFQNNLNFSTTTTRVWEKAGGDARCSALPKDPVEEPRKWKSQSISRKGLVRLNSTKGSRFRDLDPAHFILFGLLFHSLWLHSLSLMTILNFIRGGWKVSNDIFLTKAQNQYSTFILFEISAACAAILLSRETEDFVRTGME